MPWLGTDLCQQRGSSSEIRTETNNNKKKERKKNKQLRQKVEAAVELCSKGEEQIITKYLLSSLVRLCWVLAGHVSHGAVC